MVEGIFPTVVLGIFGLPAFRSLRRSARARAFSLTPTMASSFSFSLVSTLLVSLLCFSLMSKLLVSISSSSAWSSAVVSCAEVFFSASDSRSESKSRSMTESSLLLPLSYVGYSFSFFSASFVCAFDADALPSAVSVVASLSFAVSAVASLLPAVPVVASLLPAVPVVASTSSTVSAVVSLPSALSFITLKSFTASAVPLLYCPLSVVPSFCSLPSSFCGSSCDSIGLSTLSCSIVAFFWTSAFSFKESAEPLSLAAPPFTIGLLSSLLMSSFSSISAVSDLAIFFRG
mmetsp:Transcript_88/g.173  ORF Transcript_88/g.173 Transcript_88/m.173 type:complete len:288 (+) Transcript_88:1152-2015(+)